MANILISPGKYVQGAGELGKLGEYAEKYGKKALILITASGYKRCGGIVEEGFKNSSTEIVFDYFNGEFSLRVTFHEFVFQTNALPERIISDGLPNGLSPSLRSPVSRLSVVNTTSDPDKQSYDGSSGVDRARI